MTLNMNKDGIYDPEPPLLGIYLKTLILGSTRNFSRTMLMTAQQCTIAKMWKQPNHPYKDELILKWHLNIIDVSVFTQK